MKIVPQSVSLINWFQDFITPVPEERLIEVAGRTAYKSEDKITKDSSSKFIQKIIDLGHESVLEHASASFRIITDRGISHEIVRHRIASYTQESTRYCKYKDEITVIKPFDLVKPEYEIWYQACRASEINYLNLLHSGLSPQIARSVLPTCLKTEIVMTANFREWRHFLRLRTSTKAHPQMQEIANMIWEKLKEVAPNVFSSL